MADARQAGKSNEASCGAKDGQGNALAKLLSGLRFVCKLAGLTIGVALILPVLSALWDKARYGWGLWPLGQAWLDCEVQAILLLKEPLFPGIPATFQSTQVDRALLCLLQERARNQGLYKMADHCELSADKCSNFKCAGPFPDHPGCAERILWAYMKWKVNPTYWISKGFFSDGTFCSFQDQVTKMDAQICPALQPSNRKLSPKTNISASVLSSATTKDASIAIQIHSSCENMWNRSINEHETCGSQIEYLMSPEGGGIDDVSAINIMESAYPTICVPSEATDEDGTYHCGDRILWMLGNYPGLTVYDSICTVVHEFPSACAPCLDWRAHLYETKEWCSAVLRTPAVDSNGTYECGDRLHWLISDAGGRLSFDEARARMEKEFPARCPTCDLPNVTELTCAQVSATYAVAHSGIRTCGERVTDLQSTLNSTVDMEIAFELVERAFPGKCPFSKCTDGITDSNAAKTCEDMISEDEFGWLSCGERVQRQVELNGFPVEIARDIVAGAHSKCSGCKASTACHAAFTSRLEVEWSGGKFSSTCGNEIWGLISKEGAGWPGQIAMDMVANQYPTVCGACRNIEVDPWIAGLPLRLYSWKLQSTIVESSSSRISRMNEIFGGVPSSTLCLLCFYPGVLRVYLGKKWLPNYVLLLVLLFSFAVLLLGYGYLNVLGPLSSATLGLLVVTAALFWILPEESKIPQTLLYLLIGMSIVAYTSIHLPPAYSEYQLAIRSCILLPLGRESSRYFAARVTWYLTYDADVGGTNVPLQRKHAWVFIAVFQLFWAIYLRLAVANMGTPLVASAVVIWQAFLEVASRISVRKRDRMITGFFRHPWRTTKRYLYEAQVLPAEPGQVLPAEPGQVRIKRQTTVLTSAELVFISAVAVTSSEQVLPDHEIARESFYCFLNTLDMMSEYAAIVIVYFLMVFWSDYPLVFPFSWHVQHVFEEPAEPPDMVSLVWVTAMQLLVEVIVDTICTKYEQRGSDLIFVWKTVYTKKFVVLYMFTTWYASIIAVGQFKYLDNLSGCQDLLAYDMCYCVNNGFVPGGAREAYCKLIYPNATWDHPTLVELGPRKNPFSYLFLV